MIKRKEIRLELSRIKLADLGLELIYQVSLQLLLVFLSWSDTPTTGGLEFLYEQADIFGISGETLIIIMTCWSFKTCILSIMNTAKTMKGFLPITSQLMIIIWSIIATGRRIMAIIVFFLPSLGLFSILNHWKAEQLPILVRLEAFEDKVMTPDDVIQLNNMSKEIPWTSIDRWTYSATDPDDHQPPHYSLYTGLALGHTFVTFLVLMALHLISITMVKIKTVKNINKENWFNVFVHSIENLNLPFQYKDWADTDNLTVVEFKNRLREMNIEMVYSFIINIVFNMMMFVPLWWTGSKIRSYICTILMFSFPFLVHKINVRQHLLDETIMARQDERESYETANYLNKCLTPVFLTALFLEATLFILHSYTVIRLI